MGTVHHTLDDALEHAGLNPVTKRPSFQCVVPVLRAHLCAMQAQSPSLPRALQDGPSSSGGQFERLLAQSLRWDA